MILSDRDIEYELKEGDLVVEPIDDLEQQIQPASIDLRLGEEFSSLPDEEIISVNDDLSELEPANEWSVPTGELFALDPGQFVLGTTLERVEIPPHLLGRLEGRSSVGRLSIEIHSTAGIIDPGYEGEITLEITNNSSSTIVLEPGMRAGQLLIEQLTSPSRRPYGDDRGSKYQNQSGPTQSQIGNDVERAEE